MIKGTGPLTTNGIEAGVKSRPTKEELEEMKNWPTPDFATKGGWDYFKDKPDKPVMHYSVIAGWFGDHLDMPAGKFFTMFHFLEYPFSRGFIDIKSADPYDTPDFDAGFMNDKRDMAPMVWGYIQSRETARRMRAYAGEVTSMHPHFKFDSPARSKDMDLATRNAYGGPNHITANIQHGSWTIPVEAGKAPEPNLVTSNQQPIFEPLKYTKDVRQQMLLMWNSRLTGYYRMWHTLRSGCSDTARLPGILWEPAVWDPRRATVSSSMVYWMRD
jgi:alcohol oxidase